MSIDKGFTQKYIEHGVKLRSQVHSAIERDIKYAYKLAKSIRHPWYRCQALAEVAVLPYNVENKVSWRNYSKTLTDGSKISIERTFSNDKNGNDTYRLTLEHPSIYKGIYDATLMLAFKDYGLEIDNKAINVKGYYSIGNKAAPFNPNSTEVMCNAAVLKFVGTTLAGIADETLGIIVGGLGIFPACFGKINNNSINDPAFYDASNYDVITIPSQFNTGVKKIIFDFSFGRKKSEEWKKKTAKLHFYLPYKRGSDNYEFHEIIDMPL